MLKSPISFSCLTLNTVAKVRSLKILVLLKLKIIGVSDSGFILPLPCSFSLSQTAMGAEQSLNLHQRRMGASPLNNLLFERAVLEALREMAEESEVPSEQYEHAWDPEDCSPRFRLLSDRLTARRLPSALTTDAIRGT